MSKVKSRKVDNPEEEIASEHEPPSPHRLHTRTTQDNDVFLITDPPRDPSTKDSLVTSVTPDSPTAVPRNDTNAAPPTVNSKVTSGSNTNTSVAASTSSNIMSGSVVFGLLIGLVCLFFVIAVLIIRKRRSDKQNNLPSKFIHSKTISLHNAKLEPPGAFGTLSSKKKRHLQQEPLISRTSGIFTVAREDPFTRRQVHKSGIWDDPVLVAARIPLDQIQIQELIARGGFGQVFLATYQGETVAVKTLLPETAQDTTEITALFSETKVMAKLDHPCIVRFLGIAWNSLSSVSCVTEYVVGGDLRAVLNQWLDSRARPKGFDYDKIQIALDVANGLSYLHSCEPNILHRDLKSRNVLLTSELHAKLTDFGVSRERSDDRMTNAVGTSLWMAPEVMMGAHYGNKADVFSFGVLLSELDTHEMPYANFNTPGVRKPAEPDMLQMVAAGRLRVNFSSDCPEELLKLAQECIAVDPTDRPTAAEALYRLQRALKAFEVAEVAL